MMKRQIIFFIPGKTGIGECLIAIYLARQIKMSDENTQIYFFAANCYQSILKEYHINHIVLFKNCGKIKADHNKKSPQVSASFIKSKIKLAFGFVAEFIPKAFAGAAAGAFPACGFWGCRALFRTLLCLRLF